MVHNRDLSQKFMTLSALSALFFSLSVQAPGSFSPGSHHLQKKFGPQVQDLLIPWFRWWLHPACCRLEWSSSKCCEDLEWGHLWPHAVAHRKEEARKVSKHHKCFGDFLSVPLCYDKLWQVAVQQMQPLFISMICSAPRSSRRAINLSSIPISPNSFSITAKRFPCVSYANTRIMFDTNCHWT